MTRARYLVATTSAASLFAALFGMVALSEPLPRLIWNVSASAPIGLYRLRPGAHAAVGDMVAVRPPARIADWLAQRHYLPAGVPMLKHVAAADGQQVCREGAHVTVDGRLAAIARAADRLGRPLPVWRGCRTLGPGQLLLLNPDPDSMDGRYLGPFPTSSLLGRVSPILTRSTPGASLRWRPSNTERPSQSPTKGTDPCISEALTRPSAALKAGSTA